MRPYRLRKSVVPARPVFVGPPKPVEIVRAEARANFEQRGAESVQKLVAGVTHGLTPEQVAQVAQRMMDTGECAWHALSMVQGVRCFCADCLPGAKLRL